VVSGPPLADPLIQSQLQAEAMESATVGFLVWDEDRRYIAANNAACEILGTTLEELLGQRVGGHTTDAEGLIAEALRKGYVTGTAFVNRFDGSGRIEVFYATFATKSAGMPFMATVIARIPD
jgi:PAS domain-containing protein